MAEMVEKKAETAVPMVKNPDDKRQKRFISVGERLDNVLKWDSQDDELYFEDEVGKFMKLSSSDIGKLRHDNKVRYLVSANLHERNVAGGGSKPSGIQVTQANERRKQFEQVVRRTDQSARATKKMQAFVGEGYEKRWCRPDKLEDKLALGWEIVKPAEDVYAGVSATEGHYETRVKQGETEMVLLRIPKDRAAVLQAEKAERAKRLEQSADSKGASELKAMGAALVDERTGGAWQDRA